MADKADRTKARLPRGFVDRHADDIRAVKSSVGLYFALLAVSIVAICVVVAREQDLTVPEEIAASAAFSLIIVAWCIAHHRELLPQLTTVGHIGWYLLAALAAIPTFLIAHMAVHVLERLFDLPEYSYTFTFALEGYGWFWIVLIICVQPGVFEELAFRGVIQNSLQRVLSAKEALLVTTMLFAILHLALLSLPHLILIGLVLGVLRLKTGSLYPGMLMHFTHNLLVSIDERWSLTPW